MHVFIRRICALALVALVWPGGVRAAAVHDLGMQSMAGVDARATLTLQSAPTQMAMGMGAIYRLELRFVTAQNPANQTKGLVAVKVVMPDGKVQKALKMQPAGAAFVADIPLPSRGEYRFDVGSRLYDGRKRQYVFSFTRP